jgi:glycosyltransferase involved in cell wall biosynthesis
MGSKLKEAGINEKRIRHQFYSINLPEYLFHRNFGEYIIYIGRLSGEKGLYTLLKSMKMVSNCSIQLYIIGDGPLRQELEDFASRMGLSNVRFMGYQQNDNLKSMIGKARFTIVPSEWYENSPLAIYESFALGTPVIGAKLGGIPELVDDQINGLLFEAGNVDDLAEKIRWFYSHPEKVKEFSANARHKAECYFSMENNYNEILMFYDELLSYIGN